MKGKRYPNGYIEHQGKAEKLGCNISESYKEYPNYHNEFGHL